VIKLLGYHGRLTGHGFRHTMSTILHEHGFESAWIEMQLAHVDKNSIRGTYNHAQYLVARRRMLNLTLILFINSFKHMLFLHWIIQYLYL
jgi:integrase